MKKSLFILALAAVASQGAMAAAGNQEVPVQFKGQVIKGGCKITVGDNLGFVNLGTVDNTSVGVSKGTPVPVYFDFASCGDQLSSIEISGIQGQNAPFDSGEMLIPTDRADANIRLLGMDGSKAVGNGTITTPGLQTMTGKKAFFQAQLEADQAATAGAANATVNFRFTWQ